MLDGGKNIDTVFKDGLSDHEVAPDTYVWESIEKSMNKHKRQAAAIIMWRSVAAACVIALMTVTIVLLNSVSEPLVKQTAEVTPVLDLKITEDKSIVEEEIPMETENSSRELFPPKANKNTVPGEKDKPIKESVGSSFSTLHQEANNMKYLASISAVDLGGDNELNTNLHSQNKRVYYSIYNPLNAPSFEKVKKKTSISIGGIVSPSYNSKMSSGGNEAVMAASGVDVNESGINSLGGGLQVRLNTGSRWSFETGVLYAQVGQEVNNEYGYKHSRQAFLSPQMSNSAGVSNSMGPIRVSKAVPNNYAEPLVDNLVEAAFSTVSSVNSVKQTLDYIEIPMMARYSLFKSFPYLSVAGGISSNFLIDNSAYAIDGGSEQKIGETDDIKSFVLSSSLGLGVELPIYKSIHLNVEPRLKYFLNSVSSNADYNFQPYSFGVYGGLTFVIK
ncbi:MAG: PorT family protein [Bacteroidales bacterium]|nr:PorT family protein [Bacteroidales bacterium]